MEGQLQAVGAASCLALAFHGFGIHPDAHAGNLQRTAQNVVPEQQVAVQAPVIVVGGASVMGLAAGQRCADLHDEGGGVLLHISVFPLTGCQVRPQILQLLSGHKAHMLGKVYAQLGICFLDLLQCGADGAYDGAHSVLQVFLSAGFAGDDLFPVPLIHIHRMQLIQLFVPADGVHVRIQAGIRCKTEAAQCLAFPLGQAVHHLCTLFQFGNGGNVKGDRAFHAVQVVVQSGGGVHEQGSGGPGQPKLAGQVCGEALLDHANGTLRLVKAQCRSIGLFHNKFPP